MRTVPTRTVSSVRNGMNVPPVGGIVLESHRSERMSPMIASHREIWSLRQWMGGTVPKVAVDGVWIAKVLFKKMMCLVLRTP